jgi:uncharacterized protein (TIGR00725 family)
MSGPFIGVVGAGTCTETTGELAAEVGREIARSGAVLVCGGLGGVMAAAARGAKEAGGYTIGILPGPTTRDANPNIDFPIATNMGQARNVILVQTADCLISVAGGYGTLSEIALALKIGKGVVCLEARIEVPGIHPAADPSEAVRKALLLAAGGGSPIATV